VREHVEFLFQSGVGIKQLFICKAKVEIERYGDLLRERGNRTGQEGESEEDAGKIGRGIERKQTRENWKKKKREMMSETSTKSKRKLLMNEEKKQEREQEDINENFVTFLFHSLFLNPHFSFGPISSSFIQCYFLGSFLFFFSALK
jgi:hypothetical protein